MTDLTATLWVAGGGAIGAYCRYRISDLAAGLFGKNFPYGTLIVNVLGSFIMGVFVGGIRAGYVPIGPWHEFVGAGFHGALTTFSTFSMESFAAFRDGNPMKAALNILLNMVLCLGGVAAGFYLLAG